MTCWEAAVRSGAVGRSSRRVMTVSNDDDNVEAGCLQRNVVLLLSSCRVVEGKRHNFNVWMIWSLDLNAAQ